MDYLVDILLDGVHIGWVNCMGSKYLGVTTAGLCSRGVVSL